MGEHACCAACSPQRAACDRARDRSCALPLAPASAQLHPPFCSGGVQQGGVRPRAGRHAGVHQRRHGRGLEGAHPGRVHHAVRRAAPPPVRRHGEQQQQRREQQQGEQQRCRPLKAGDSMPRWEGQPWRQRSTAHIFYRAATFSRRSSHWPSRARSGTAGRARSTRALPSPLDQQRGRACSREGRSSCAAAPQHRSSSTSGGQVSRPTTQPWRPRHARPAVLHTGCCLVRSRCQTSWSATCRWWRTWARCASPCPWRASTSSRPRRPAWPSSSTTSAGPRRSTPRCTSSSAARCVVWVRTCLWKGVGGEDLRRFILRLGARLLQQQGACVGDGRCVRAG